MTIIHPDVPLWLAVYTLFVGAVIGWLATHKR